MLAELVASHQLKATLHRVKTLSGGTHVYKDADIHVKTVNPDDLSPTSKYVLRDNLKQIEALREKVFREKGVDIFHFPGIVSVDGAKIAPPVIEEINDSDLIVDGLHRSYLARRNGEKIVVAHIRHSLRGYEPIGSGLGWFEVKVTDTQPTTGRDCRILRLGVTDDPTDLRRYYRDFSVLGSRGRRPRQGQNG